jgi:predicted negative regulator of RcsB-dependent stress response
MPENTFEAQYDISKKSKLQVFFKSNKILIISVVSLLTLTLILLSFYSENKKNKRILLGENYIKAKIYLENNEKAQALDTLREIIYSNDATYSTLSLFLIMNQNLVSDKNELTSLFNHLLENIKFEKDIKNLIIYKKTLLNINSLDESDLLSSLKPLLNSKSIWKPHSLLLLGDYFFEKNEYNKAIEFYQKIFEIKFLNNELYNYARSQLVTISNE